MAKRKKKPNYRALKKALNRYYGFSFAMPRKGVDFTPQQKSAITRKYNKVRELIDNPGVSWIPYPENSKLPKVDGVRTSKGIFYKYPGATAKYSKRDKKYHIVVSPTVKKGRYEVAKRKDILFLFPKSILKNPGLIPAYVDMLRERYNPDEIRWSNKSRRESQAYDESLFNFYFSLATVDYDTGEEIPEEELTEEEVADMPKEQAASIWKKRKFEWKLSEDDKFYNGVFLIYYLGEIKHRRKRQSAKKRKKRMDNRR